MVRLLFVIHLFLIAVPLRAEEFVVGVNQRDVYRFKDEANKWVGIDIELIKAVFRRTPHTLKVVEMTWPRVLKSIERGEVDLTLSAGVFPERQEYAYFTNHPFRYSYHVLFVRKSKLDKFKSVKTVSDLISAPVTIGALRGAIYGESYYNMLKNPEFFNKIAFLDNDRNMAKFVLKGRVDGYIDAEFEGKAYLARNPAFQREIIPYMYINTDDEASGMIMFSKKTMSKELVAQFDDALRQVHESGEYQTIIDRFKR